jgi:enoyl-CoA hydratase/carnithine racemase
MDYETILLEKREGIAYLTLNRPERANTISRQLSADVLGALDEVAADTETRVVIVTGAGRHFCGGADLRDMGRSVTGGGNPTVAAGGRDMMSRFEEIPQPVIAAINGAAMGGGCEIALACDIRIMSTSAQIGVPEIRFGALPAGGGTARLPRVVGMGKAKELIYSGLPITAEEAERIGLVNKAVPPEELMPAAEAMARVFSERAAYALAAAKFLLNKGRDVDTTTALALERRIINTMASPEERAAARDQAAATQATYANIFGKAAQNAS